jgi:hypothetical protein
MAAAAILDFLLFHFRFSFFRICRYVKSVLAKFDASLINSNEMAAWL